MILKLTKNSKEVSLLVLAVFNVSLIAFRMAVTESLFYGFLVWNLVLAALPYLVTWYLGENPQYVKSKFALLLCSAIWLLFLPNAPYLITDFLHFKKQTTGMPAWFDLLLLMSFSWNGIALGLVSMADMQRFWEQRFGLKISVTFIFCCSLLSGFGIYLGRYLRFNSWDILHHPIDLFSAIFPLVSELRSIGFTIGYGLFVFISYSFFKINSAPNL